MPTTYTRNNGGVFPPRFDYDPVTLAPKGILSEEQRTNLLLRSEEFDSASWSKTSGVTVTPNTTVAPDGTTTADTITANGLAGAVLNQGVVFTGDGTKSVSVFLKAGTSGTSIFFVRDITVPASRGLATITWTGGVPSAVASSGGTIEGVENYGNGWYRIKLIVTGVIAANSNVVRLQPDSAAGTGTTEGNLIFSVYDQDHNLLFTNSQHSNAPYWDFRVNTTVNVIIEATLNPASGKESGCAILLIGFKQ
jgi:hypothetical protein